MESNKIKIIIEKLYSGQSYFAFIITVGTIYPLNLLSQPLSKPRFNEVSIFK